MDRQGGCFHTFMEGACEQRRVRSTRQPWVLRQFMSHLGRLLYQDGILRFYALKI